MTRYDLFTFFLPWYTFLGDRLRDLAVPGWNPHLFSGTPFAGDPESGWMYLPAMLGFALLPAVAAFKSMVALQLAVAGLSTYAFTRVLGMGPLASLLAATLYVTGPLLHWNTYCCLVFAEFATWIPLALLGVELAVRASGWRTRLAGWFLGGLAVSQMFAGWVGEGWLYAVLLPAAYAGYRALLSSPRPGLSLPARLLSGAATAILVPGLGMALGAAGILPRLAVNAEMNLAGGDYSRLGAAGVLNPPWQLDYLLVQVLGLGTGYHFRAASLGGVAVVLSLLALPLARERFAVPFFAALTLVSLTLTLESSPLLPLFSLIPRFRAFHDHDAWRVIALAAFGPAVLSGAALEALPAWRGRRSLLSIVVAPLLLLAIAAVVLARLGAVLGWPPLIAAAVTTVLVALLVAAPVGRPRDGQSRWMLRAVPVLVLAVAIIQPAGMELTGSWLGWPHSAAWERRWTPEPGSEAALVRETSRSDPEGAGAFLQQALATSEPFRYVGYGGVGYPGDEARRENYMARRYDPHVQAILANGRPIFLGLDDIQGYNPLQLSRYVEFMAALNGAPQDY
ncbi:MAG TPA: hypothetical protein VFM12_08180, partial [Gemmatimonadales bacterium]|nr:hypothetical protein [Gemmatimonadales bacterium]